MDIGQGVVSSRLLSILDEASERTFLSNELKGDASKDVLDDKNLVASLSIIFEQSLVSSLFHSQWSSLNGVAQCWIWFPVIAQNVEIALTS